MATLSITATSVTAAINGVAKQSVQWGETMTAGCPVYQKAADGLFWKMQADGTAAESGVGVVYGVALSGGNSSQWGVIATSGPVTIGAVVVVGTHYYVHATAGLIGLFSDLASTNYITDLGYATTTAIITLSGSGATGLQLA